MKIKKRGVCGSEWDITSSQWVQVPPHEPLHKAIEVGVDVFEMNSLKLNSRRLNQSHEALVVKEWQRSSWYTDLSAEDGIGA